MADKVKNPNKNDENPKRRNNEKLFLGRGEEHGLTY